ncbi:MAG: hypothetical protein J6K61_03670 [Clostridia bacterium]|nr:hypothetical protein [Clostridia bacterium]
MKKRILALCLALFAVMSLAACSGNGDGTPDGFQKASLDKACSYELYVPESWVVSSGSETDYTMTSIAATDPCSLSVAVVDTLVDQTYDTYWQEKQEEYKKLFDTFTPDEASAQGAVVNGSNWDGRRYLFNATYGEKEYRCMQIFIPHSSSLVEGYRLYVVTYMAQKDHFDTHYDNEQDQDIATILSYFKFR